LWSFPYYLIGAPFAGIISWSSRAVGWQIPLLMLPVMYLSAVHRALGHEGLSRHTCDRSRKKGGGQLPRYL